MKDPANIPTNDTLVFITPKGRKVYGGGGITPDIYISNEETPEDIWNSYIMQSNLVDRFVFLELDKNINKYNFDNVAQFFNEELPYKEDFIAAFKEYCEQNNYPIEIENEESLLNSIKAFIAIQLFDENLYTRIVNQGDPFILRTLSEMDKE
jgi:carboxyl-terminal processing protease